VAARSNFWQDPVHHTDVRWFRDVSGSGDDEEGPRVRECARCWEDSGRREFPLHAGIARPAPDQRRQMLAAKERGISYGPRSVPGF